MTILSLDLGKFKSVSCMYDSNNQAAQFETIHTSRHELTRLIAVHKPDVVVFEACSAAGWLMDLCQELGVAYKVANTNGEAWRWRNVKRKTDRDDALKLARLTASGDLPVVTLPSKTVRTKRALLKFRDRLISHRVSLQNAIRALFQQQGIEIPRGTAAWSERGVAMLSKHTRSLADCEADELWRGQLALLIEALKHAWQQERTLEQKLERMAREDTAVQRLQTIPGVGRVTAETVVAWIDDPHRFRNGREVSAYAGLVPRQFQSGELDRRGRITKRGPGLLRKVLVEASWMMMRYNEWGQRLMLRISRGQKTRRKQALVAVARKLLVRCWAMLRDGTDWNPPPLPATG